MKALDGKTARLLALVHEGASEKLAREPVALDVREVTVMTDVLYVCHGDSTRAVEAITLAITSRLEDAGARPSHVEGRGQGQWVLIDLGELMVHVFLKDRRAFYNLERLWHDARAIALT